MSASDIKTLKSLRIGGSDLLLQYGDGKYYLASPLTCSTQELTQAEANEVIQPNVKWELRSRAIGPQPEIPLYPEFEGELSCLHAAIPTEQRCIMLDTSTIRAALGVLAGWHLTPLSLLDLAIFSFAIVCFDRIVVQPYGYVSDDDPLESGALSDAVIKLKYPEGFIQRRLWSLCAGMDNELSEDERQSDNSRAFLFANAWASFLGYEPGSVKLDFHAYDTHQRSPGYWSGMLAERYAYHYFSGKVTALGKDQQEFLSITTMRTLFNDRLAGLLRLPYLASSFRAPVLRELISEKVQLRMLVDKLLSVIDPRPLATRATDSPYMTEWLSPFILGFALDGARRPNEVVANLGKLRKRMEPLRQKLTADRDRESVNSAEYLRDFLRFFNQDMPPEWSAAQNTVQASVSVGTAIATATTRDTSWGNLAAKLITLLNPVKRAHDLFIQYFRPEIYLLFDLVAQVKLLQRLNDRIDAIWGPQFSRREFELMQDIADKYPSDFLKVRSSATR